MKDSVLCLTPGISKDSILVKCGAFGLHKKVIVAGGSWQFVPDLRDNNCLKRAVKFLDFPETALVTQLVCCHLTGPFAGQTAHNGLAPGDIKWNRDCHAKNLLTRNVMYSALLCRFNWVDFLLRYSKVVRRLFEGYSKVVRISTNNQLISF